MSAIVDVHNHLIPDFYRTALDAAGIGQAGGRELPGWTPDAAVAHMDALGVATAIVSVSTPGTGFVKDPAQATALSRRLNDYSAQLTAERPDRFGWFATLALPDVASATAEARRSLDAGADGVTLLANNRGVYVGSEGQDELFALLDERRAVVFIHPAALPGPEVEGIPPFAADFLLDTTRAAYLLVRNRVVERFPRVRFILSHAGGFVPYGSHRLAMAIAVESGRSPAEVLEDFRGFWFDTALSSSPAALPTLLAFARPGHVLFGSDWPFAPTPVGRYFAHGLDSYAALDAEGRAAIHRGNATALFPRLGST